MERIVGPVLGFYLACYSVESAEGHYGYVKICTARVKSPWDSPLVAAKLAVGPCASAFDAIEAVSRRATDRLVARDAALRFRNPWRKTQPEG